MRHFGCCCSFLCASVEIQGELGSLGETFGPYDGVVQSALVDVIRG